MRRCYHVYIFVDSHSNMFIFNSTSAWLADYIANNFSTFPRRDAKEVKRFVEQKAYLVSQSGDIVSINSEAVSFFNDITRLSTAL